MKGLFYLGFADCLPTLNHFRGTENRTVPDFFHPGSCLIAMTNVYDTHYVNIVSITYIFLQIKCVLAKMTITQIIFIRGIYVGILFRKGKNIHLHIWKCSNICHGVIFKLFVKICMNHLAYYNWLQMNEPLHHCSLVVGERASAITGTDNSMATHWQLTGTSVAPQWQVCGKSVASATDLHR